MDDSNPYEPTSNTEQPVTKYERDVRQWSMFIHFSLLAGFAVPGAGLILPVVLWQIKKDEFPEVDVHGKLVVNWIISLLIYSVICFLLCFLFIGFFLLPLLAIASVIFAIVGGIKANNGEVWEYPLNIKFL